MGVHPRSDHKFAMSGRHCAVPLTDAGTLGKETKAACMNALSLKESQFWNVTGNAGEIFKVKF